MTTHSLPVQTFMQEANEVMESLEERLLALEADPTNAELIDAVFRNLHTLKGSGEMFGFIALARFTHSFENAYDAVRSGTKQVTDALIDVSLRSRDHIQRLIDIGADDAANAAMLDDADGKVLLKDIDAFLGGGESAAAPVEAATTPAAPARWRLRFDPGPGTFRNGLRPDLMIEELADLGESTVAAETEAVPLLDALDAAVCHLVWSGEIVTDAGQGAIEDVFLFADEEALSLEALGPVETPAPAPAPSTAPAPAPATASPAKPPAKAKAETEAPKAAKKSESVRVQSHRLDELMDQLGELVIAQARLNGLARESADANLIGTAEEIERLITGLRDATLSIRMLPIGTVFSKFRRVVRDLSSELGKDVALVTAGEDTELDKNVIDSLSEPLVHIIRNSVDHGIEGIEERRAAGKSERATVTMAARQSGGEVLVSVSDDGGGIRTAKVRARAVERGLIGEDEDLSDKQINQLIFAPGFSTAEKLSSVSGRGVGMDAVRSVINDLGGSVEVDSHAGRGTDITLRLPLTLAIIEGLLVRIGPQAFVLPLATVDECVEMTAEETSRDSGRAILTIRNELVPFIDLVEQFGFAAPEREATRRIVIVRMDKRRVGLVIDEIVGQHQTVIKSLSPYHRDIAGLAGGTILGDGSVALILDPLAIVRASGGQIAEAA
ncbi:MAG: chemotaxis protein CheA [Pseudomonadota bacterium]